jgi:SAM-dependent methyltransferase
MVDEKEKSLEYQINDDIVNPLHRDSHKNIIYKYCDFLTQKCPEINYSQIKILDVGCREFFTYDYFREKYENNIYGIDVGLAGLKYTQANNKPVIEADAHDLLALDELKGLGLALAFHSLEHMYDLDLVLRNIHSSLINNGVLYFAIPMPSHKDGKYHWQDIESVEKMKEICSRNGFSCIFSSFFQKGVFRSENEMLGIFRKM